MTYRHRSLSLNTLLMLAMATGMAAGIAAWSHSDAAAAGADPASEPAYLGQTDRDWTAEIASAEKRVAAARTAADADPQQLADALTLLGDAQFGAKNLVAAEAAYTEALQIVEPRVGPASDKLLGPTQGLGYTLAATGKHERAVVLLEKALIVSRRNFGLFDTRQQGLLRQLAQSLTAVDAVGPAEQHLLYLLRLGERAYGPRDVRMVPLLCSVGDWYTQIGSLSRARENYRLGLAIAEKNSGQASLAAIEPLRGFAATYRQELFLSDAGLLAQSEPKQSAADFPTREERPIAAHSLNIQGERALLRAVQILETNPDPPTSLMIHTLVDVGDWYQVRTLPEKALPYYRRASALVVPPVSADAAPNDPFAFPVQVYLPTPSLATRNRSRPDAEIEERFVQVEFTVTHEGAVKDERVADRDATARQAAETLSAIRAARYRPKFVAGEPVDTTAVSYRQTFRQRKDKDAEKDKTS